MMTSSIQQQQRHVLSIDPGSAKLGMSYVKWNGLNCNDEKNFSIEWMCLIHLTSSFKGSDDLTQHGHHRKLTNDIVKYKEMHDQFERLSTFLEHNENFNSILEIKDIRVCIEQQEGARDINVLFRLMRINFLVGVICGYLKRKKVQFTFVPKTYKCGWSFLGTMAKKKLEGVIKTQHKKTLSEERKKALLKQYKKETTCAFVKRIVHIGESSNEIKRFSTLTRDFEFNHIADSVSQAIRYIKELHGSGCYNVRHDDTLQQSLKKVKDNISSMMKNHLSTLF